MNRKIIIMCATIGIALLAGCTLKSGNKISIETPEEISDILKEYEMVGVGDSLMHGMGGNGDSFCEYLQKDYGAVCNNYSANGAGWSPVEKAVYSYKTQLSKIKRDIDEGKKYEILLLEGGLNTIESLKSINEEATKPSDIIGSMNELEDKTKISGIVEDNVSVVYDYFQEHGRYIFYIYPAIPEKDENEYYTAYQNFMIDYCKEKGIVIIDLNDTRMEDNDTYYSVGMHYTDKGYKLTSDYIAKTIAETIVSDMEKKSL